MTVKELIEKLMQEPNQETEVRIKHGCLIVKDRILIDTGEDIR